MMQPYFSPSDASGEVTFRQLWATLRRSRWLVLLTVAVLGTSASLYTRNQRPVFESSASLRIDDDNRQSDPILSSLLKPLGALGSQNIETEMIVLRSRQLAEAVVDTLNLTVEVHVPAAPRDSILRLLAVPPDAPSGTFQLKHNSGDDYLFSVIKASPQLTNFPTLVRIGVPFSVGPVQLMLAKRLQSKPEPLVRFAIQPFRYAVGEVQKQLRVFRPDPKADVVNVSFRSTDAVLAASVPNTVGETFIDYKARISKAESHNTVSFLKDQVANYDRELERAEQQLRAYQENRRVVSLPDEAREQVTRLARLQADREHLRSERDVLAKFLASAREALRNPTDPSPYRQLASYPAFFNNRAVQEILLQLMQIENERSSLLTRRTLANPEVQALTQRVKTLELQLYTLATNYAQGLESQLVAIDRSLQGYAASLEGIPEREIEFARLSRRQKLLAELNTLLQTRLKEAEIRQAAVPGDVRMIDTALVPQRPVAPRPVQNLVLALTLGVVLGVAIAFGREALETRVRTREEAIQASGGLAVVGVIPEIQEQPVSGSGARRLIARARRSGASVSRPLITLAEPKNPASEAFRSLRTNLYFAKLEGELQAVAVTSALPGEGKSTTSANVAITFAQQSAKTLLVDADLRRGMLHQSFGTRQEPGLAHLLVGRTSLSDVVQEINLVDCPVPLHIISRGLLPPNPAELLGSPRMGEILEQMRAQYDMIIFDTPPLNLVTDAAIIARLVDTTLLVIRVNVTQRQALQFASSQLAHVHAAVAGIVVNGMTATDGYGYGYGYSYGYGVAKNGKHSDTEILTPAGRA